MEIVYQNNVAMAPFTTFGVGGNAECFVEAQNTDQLLDILHSDIAQSSPITVLSYGSNTLVSDAGIPGLTVCARGGNLSVDGDSITVDAGVWWDDVVMLAIEHGLWGAELMSQIPGSIGAATYINITAYGQSIGPLIEWVEYWDPKTKMATKLLRENLKWDYKQSVFQTDEFAGAIVLRVCLKLSPNKTDELSYQKAIDVAQELGSDTETLQGRRLTIIEARRRAGSIWNPHDPSSARTAGSFFRNPVVDAAQAESIILHDESGKSAEQIKQMNLVHGGDSRRVSAAHVMLAAGFKRGQLFGSTVKLNDQNLLKVEALPGATATDIYNAAQEIITTCNQKLGIKLQPEAEFIGKF